MNLLDYHVLLALSSGPMHGYAIAQRVQQVSRDIRTFFLERVYDTVIPRNIRLGEAPSHGIPGILYDAKSRGAEAYFGLAREILARDAAPAPTGTEQYHG